MPELLRFQTTPYYAQVAMIDPTIPDGYPDWGDGTAEVAADPHGIAVGTQPDHLGKVAVEVWDRDAPEDSLRTIGRYELEVGNDGVVVGSVVGNDLRPVQLGTGRHRISVLARDGSDGPELVRFLVDMA